MKPICELPCRCSLVVERLIRNQMAVGSIPTTGFQLYSILLKSTFYRGIPRAILFPFFNRHFIGGMDRNLASNAIGSCYWRDLRDCLSFTLSNGYYSEMDIPSPKAAPAG